MAKMHVSIPALKLNDETSIPLLGFGSGTAWYKTRDEDQIDYKLVTCIKMAISMGYTHFDSSEAYGTEMELGIAIKESGADRSKLYVTSKVLGGIENIPKAINTSLEKLGLDYVDLYLIHTPRFAHSDQDLQTAWVAMEEVKASGKAISIGVSNFHARHLKALEKIQKIKPSINQIEFHPYLQPAELLEYHRAHGIATAAYSPLTSLTKASPGPVDSFFASLAKKYAVTAAEIALRFCIDQDVVAITTSSKEQRMSDMLRVATFKLTPAEIQTMIQLGQQKHFRGFRSVDHEEEDKS